MHITQLIMPSYYLTKLFNNASMILGTQVLQFFDCQVDFILKNNIGRVLLELDIVL